MGKKDVVDNKVKIIIQSNNLKPEELSELGFLKLELKGAENFYSYNLDSTIKKGIGTVLKAGPIQIISTSTAGNQSFI